MILVGLDLETDGLEMTNRITEIGVVLWDTEAKRPLKIFNQLVNDPEVNITPEIQRINGITSEDLIAYGLAPEKVFKAVSNFFTTFGVHAVVAHNGNDFDRPMLKANMARFGIALPERNWIDTTMDIDYPPSITTRKLTHLAAEHGFLNPFAHRAVFDVLTMLHILSRYDIEEVFSNSRSPSITLTATAVLPPWRDEGKSNAEVKAHGFRWNADAKTWTKKVRKNRYEPGSLPFPVTGIEDLQ